MNAPPAPVRRPEEAYQMAEFFTRRRRSSSSHTSMQDASVERERTMMMMPAEEYGEEQVDAYVAEDQQGFTQESRGKVPTTLYVHLFPPWLLIKGARHPTSQDIRIKHPRLRLAASFFLFGVLNNILYVLILSAALDLVPATTPAGLVAFTNICPSLLTKLFWPYLSHGAVHYKLRISICTAASGAGMLIISTCNSTGLRLLGIAVASFSSGLGEMTFLQLTTTLPTPSLSRDAIGAWSSGTGGAGIAGAGLWWGLRSLGVQRGLAFASFLPWAFPVVFFGLFPASYRPGVTQDDYTGSGRHAIFTVDDDDDGGEDEDEDNDDDDLSAHIARKVKLPPVPLHAEDATLSTEEKIELVKPLLLRYMLPLFLVYAFEYIINTGVAPTLAFPPPSTGVWSRVFKSIRDYYPFWSLTYQTFVFLSRSSLSLGLAPLPKRLLFLPAACQAIIMTLLSLQASHYIFSPAQARPHHGQPAQAAHSSSWWSWVVGWLHNTTTSTIPTGGAEQQIPTDRAISVVFALICLEGLMGGTGYCMTYYHIGREDDHDHGEQVHGYERVAENGQQVDDESALHDSGSTAGEKAKRKARKEFRMAAAGAADSLGIVFASLISMPVEVALCNAQVKAGSSICKEL
ncbi:hypothetical protein QFC21_006017 [Naganishia friedmannii]|uniref:Uncharacterized protein n=1 Tax=Naganishia friedmannii TaxID=89922 RepID=A0ACC2V549_9TREE|nr:hypothetical protein QFC21_006017 [Naganishia friedmannii]